MRGGDKNIVVAFILPFENLVSNFVRAKSLEDFAVDGVDFVFVQGKYNPLFCFKYARVLWRYFFYLKSFAVLRMKGGLVVLYFIKPEGSFLLGLAKALGLKIILDVNDPYHLKELYGPKTTRALFDYADHVVFESVEYAKFSNIDPDNFTIIEDTPQNETVNDGLMCREKKVVWIGSVHTSIVLPLYIDNLLFFYNHGYKINLLGCSIEIAVELRNCGLDFDFVDRYNREYMEQELYASLISFVPMPDEPLYAYRGNLKAKISMSYGCVTIASDLSMHERLISSGVTGYLFKDFDDFKEIVLQLNSLRCAEISNNASKFVAINFSRNGQAAKICNLAKRLVS